MLKLWVKFKSGKEDVFTFYHFERVIDEFYDKINRGIIVDYEVIG